MKPVYQSVRGSLGNCFEACLASILECDLEAIPTPLVTGTVDEWFDEATRVLAPTGYALAYCSNAPPLKPTGYHIGVGDYHDRDGERVAHAVVYHNGVPVHCPVYGAATAQVPEYWVLLIPREVSA